MKHTKTKLSEYGLTFYLVPKDYDRFTVILFENSKNAPSLPMLFCSKMFITIEDVTLFKEKFEIPKKYNFLTDDVLATLCAEANKHRAIHFCGTTIRTNLETIVNKSVRKNQDFYLKNHKKFKLKFAFHQKGANEFMASELLKMCHELFEEPATLSLRQQLYSELNDALLQDHFDYQMKLRFKNQNRANKKEVTRK